MGLSPEQRRQWARDMCIDVYGIDPEALRKDAERYQWLRSRIPGSAYRIMGVVYSEGGDCIDAEIDAAMRAEQFPGVDIDSIHGKA